MCSLHGRHYCIQSNYSRTHFQTNGEFSRLRKANLKIQLDKCEFLSKKVAYRGHIITKDGEKPNPEKIRAIKDLPEPKDSKGIKSFLGLSGYYREFIPQYAKISKSLTNLL